MVRVCPLPDMHPQILRSQVCTVESQTCDAADYGNEIALLQDHLELYEKEKRVPAEEPDFGDEAQ